MVFTTHCWKKQAPNEAQLWRGLLLGWQLACVGLCLLLGLSAQVLADTTVEPNNLKLSRSTEGVFLSADWQFELPTALEDALVKGVPLYFVTEAEVTQERWYFYDKRVASAERHVRVQYQPLTRRWRVTVLPHAFSSAGMSVSLGQSHDTLDEALRVVKRLSQWRIASASEVGGDGKHNLTLKFKLDLAQLPRPLQIGAMAQSEWNLSFVRTQRLLLELER